MMSLSNHTTGRVVTENSTSCCVRIPFDLSAVGGGGLLIYANTQTNFKFLVMKCHFFF